VSVFVGLISSLGRLRDGEEEYVIIGHWQGAEWLKPYFGSNQRLVIRPRVRTQRDKLKQCLGPLQPFTRRIWRALFASLLSKAEWPQVAISDGFYENLGCDVIHFPYPNFVLCSLPTIYNPHDLQHLHYPQFFKPSHIAWRETVYRSGCYLSNTVVAGSDWVKQDIVRHYGVDLDKVQVIPWAPPTQIFPAPSEDKIKAVREKYCLEPPFAFYPATTWKHKNHVRLLEAAARLRDHDDWLIRIVCTGALVPDQWTEINRHLDAHSLRNQVRFLGVVPPGDIRSIYRLAQFVVVPTLFEAASGPIFEAWEDGVPVACSTVTSLPEQVKDAALLFDPFSVDAIAMALHRMSSEETLRNELNLKGQRRLKDFDWERTAKAYRAVYRRAANFPLTDEDRWLLSWDWMRDSNLAPLEEQ
jgi:glycosyltransferase involved in cell wall biosynthesis